MIFFDTETCGLHGMAVLIQWAEDDGPIHLHSVWTQPIRNTLELLKKFATHPGGVVGFNLAFDWFHVCKLWTVLSSWPDPETHPEEIIDALALLEPAARDGNCIKPVTACDIMLHARKGPYQSTMDRENIRIKRVPSALAWDLAEELERRVKLNPIYFARRKDKHAKQWQVYDIQDEDGDPIHDFKDVVLAFRPSTALKALATDALKLPVDTVLLFTDIEIESKFYPEEYGYAPFALAVGRRGKWNNAWPEKIKYHISHWNYNELARKYACDDVKYTRDLYKHFGSPEPGDDDSVLACMVASVRWRGYKVDLARLAALRETTIKSKTKILANGQTITIPTHPSYARRYVEEFMDDTEKLIIQGSTKKVLLQEITRWKADCPECKGEGELISVNPKKTSEYVTEITPSFPKANPKERTKCEACGGSGEVPHRSAERATEVLEARQSNYEVDLFDKFLLAGRFHASFAVIGTLSSRMAGGDGLNAQGIKKTKEVRGCFPLGHLLCGGDFAGFEVTLAEACYHDVNLRKDLQSGKKIHALFGVHVYPDMTYEQILATEGTKDDRYTRCKQAVFAMFYGGEGFTLKDRLGVDIETADAAYAAFVKRYPQVGREREKIKAMFCSMRQPNGIGSRVEWFEPADYIESMFGFRRYFTLENRICRALYDLANSPPKEWKKIQIKVVRRDRAQTAMGAVQSALFGAAFAMQSANMRAAANHVIQSAGAQITKLVERKIWDIQPAGINPWIVQPMNIHDEIMCPTDPSATDRLKEVVNETVESLRPKVPLIKMEWVTGLNSWAEKG